MPGHIEMLVTRPLVLFGQRREAGTVLKVESITANGLLASGRARLVRDSDLPLLCAAEAQHTMRLCSAQSTRGRSSLAQR